MINVLFVCAGNICRSPMAEAVFQHMVNEAGLSDQIQSDSAGTGDWHVGELAHVGTRNVLKKHNIPYNGRARQFIQRDLSQFDYVVVMDAANMRGVERYIRPDDRAKVHMFLEFANTAATTPVKEVPDPYYDGRFDEVYDLVTLGAAALLAHIRAEHNL
ncbi:MAG: low molecular weight protein-tyrosine-phosphatase [Anaerolineae bacterium]